LGRLQAVVTHSREEQVVLRVLQQLILAEAVQTTLVVAEAVLAVLVLVLQAQLLVVTVELVFIIQRMLRMGIQLIQVILVAEAGAVKEVLAVPVVAVMVVVQTMVRQTLVVVGAVVTVLPVQVVAAAQACLLLTILALKGVLVEHTTILAETLSIYLQPAGHTQDDNYLRISFSNCCWNYIFR